MKKLIVSINTINNLRVSITIYKMLGVYVTNNENSRIFFII